MSEERARGPATPAGKLVSLGFTALAAVIAGAAIGIVIGLRLANDDQTPGWQMGWIVAWLAVGVVDAVIGATLVTRYGHRRLGGCLIVIGGAALVLAVATQAQFATADGAESNWAVFVGAKDWAQPVAAGVLAALLPWELVRTNRRTSVEIIWWMTAVTIAATAVGYAVGFSHPLLTALEWLVALSATAATVRLIVLWWTHRMIDDPLPAVAAIGAAAAWLAVVPEQFEIGYQAPLGNSAAALFTVATLPLLVVAAVVNALRERPGRFQGVSHDVISWVLVSGAILVMYAGGVVGLSFVLGPLGLPGRDRSVFPLLATAAIIALVADPVRRRTRDAADRLVWGARDDPLEVVRGVVEHVGADSGDELLPALADSLRRDLRLDFVAIDVSDPNAEEGWRREAEFGPVTTYSRTVELDQHGEVVGRLIVGWEYGPMLRARDEHVLTALVGPLALAVGWVRLTADLRRSSVAIVSAREEERRRLWRDLHDGLGPALYSVSMGLRTQIRRIDRGDAEDTMQMRQAIERLAEDVDSISSDLRRIVRDLAPAALEQLGLVGAVEQFARGCESQIEIHTSLPTEPVKLPAAVELASYRIVTEAVTNVLRHARAGQCWLTISAGETVEIDIVDDGIGINGRAHDGFGIPSIQERAEELGGSADFRPNQPRGTHVHACLPTRLP